MNIILFPFNTNAWEAMDYLRDNMPELYRGAKGAYHLHREDTPWEDQSIEEAVAWFGCLTSGESNHLVTVASVTLFASLACRIAVKRGLIDVSKNPVRIVEYKRSAPGSATEFECYVSEVLQDGDTSRIAPFYNWLESMLLELV